MKVDFNSEIVRVESISYFIATEEMLFEVEKRLVAISQDASLIDNNGTT